jgi:hypothetical protein
MNKFKLGYMLFLTAVSITVISCTSNIPSSIRSKQITITKGHIAVNCKYRGKVFVKDTEGRMDTPHQHSSLQSEKIEQLKIQAIKLGANTIVLSSLTNMSHVKHSHGKSLQITSATHHFKGDAYWCPAS